MPANDTPEGRAPHIQILRAGPLVAELDGSDLWHVRFGGDEVIRRVYVAIRDEQWRTIGGCVTKREVRLGDEDFAVTIEATHLDGPIRFSWKGRIVGSSNGHLEYTINGAPLASFSANRLGICIDHPLETCAGRDYRIDGPAGTREGTLPTHVLPQRLVNGIDALPITGIERMILSSRAGLELSFEYGGAPFGMEDQRNFTDMSFKTCTQDPVDFPLHFTRGSGVAQRVRFVPRGVPARAHIPQPVTVRVGEPLEQPMPAFGVGLPVNRPLTQPLVSLLSELAPAFLRAICANRLEVERALESARAVGAPLELVTLVEEDEEPLPTTLERLEAGDIRRLIVVPRAGAIPTPEMVEAVRDRFDRPTFSVGAGSRIGFVGITSYGFDPAASDVVWWETDPQVHATDDRTVMENCLGVAETVHSAHLIAPGRPVSVAVGFGPGGDDDSRLGELFAGAWTVGAAAGLVAAAADTVSWFRATGPGGIIRSGEASPPFHVIEELLILAQGKPLRVGCDNPVLIAAIAAVLPAGRRGLLANLTGQELEISLDAATLSGAVWHSLFPNGWRRHAGPGAPNGRLRLSAYEVVRFAALYEMDSGS